MIVASCNPRNGDGRKITQTKNDLKQLQILIIGDLPVSYFSAKKVGDSGSMTDFINQLPDQDKQLFLKIKTQDSWASSFHYEFINADELHIWSFGPNRIDDRGRGDDIGVLIDKKNLYRAY